MDEFGTAQEVIQRMQSARDRGLGVWFNDVPFDEGLSMIRGFCESNEFFADYNHHDLVDLLCVMDVLQFNAKAPITKLGEISTWVGILLKGTVDVYVKGTKVGKIPTGAMIGDTGTIEGGKRSADCEGSEGGGVIALLRFDKMDMLHTTQACLAYKLAMSFGGVVVRKLRQAMGKVFKKDNKARAGENIGKRMLLIPETKAPNRRPPSPSKGAATEQNADLSKTTATKEVTEEEGTPDALHVSNAPDDSNNQNGTKEEKKSKWKLLKHAVKTVQVFKETPKKMGNLAEEEILYLARAKKIRDPLSAEAEKKMKQEMIQLKKERDNALTEIDRMKVAVKNAQSSDTALLLEAKIASAGCQRYEKLWISDYHELQELKLDHSKMKKEFLTMKDVHEDMEARHLHTLSDMEDELEFMRGREIQLGKKNVELESEIKMLRIRLQSRTMKHDEHVSKTKENKTEMYDSIARLSDLLINQKKESFQHSQEMTKIKKKSDIIIRKERLRRKWAITIARAVSKRLHAVRRVAKIHSAWFKQTSKSTNDKHCETMNAIETWTADLHNAKEETNRIKNKNEYLELKVKQTNGKNVVLTNGLYVMLYRLQQSNAVVQEGILKNKRLKKKCIQSEVQVTLRDGRIKDAFLKLEKNEQKAKDERISRMNVWTTLHQITKELKEKNDVITKLKEHLEKSEKKTKNNVHLLQQYLLESDRENVSLANDRRQLRNHLSTMVQRIFSSECRRVELEKSFGQLSKPSKELSNLLHGNGFSTNLAIPIHHPISSYVDQEKVTETNRKKIYNDGLRTPPPSRFIDGMDAIQRPQTAPQNNLHYLDCSNDHQTLPELIAGGGGGSPLPQRASPPPYYPDNDKTRRGMPSFDDGVSRTLSYWDNSRKHYIDGLTGNTAKAGVKRFWGSSEKTKKNNNCSYSNTRNLNHSSKKSNGHKHPLSNQNENRTSDVLNAGSSTDRWYLHQKFAQHYMQLSMSPANRTNELALSIGGQDRNELSVTRECPSSSKSVLRRKSRNGAEKSNNGQRSGGKQPSRDQSLRAENSGMLSGWDQSVEKY
jgi:hypothetical protein